MNQLPPNSGFQPEEIDRVIVQYGKPLPAELRKALTDRLSDERERYEAHQRENKSKQQQREGRDR